MELEYKVKQIMEFAGVIFVSVLEVIIGLALLVLTVLVCLCVIGILAYIVLTVWNAVYGILPAGILSNIL